MRRNKHKSWFFKFKDPDVYLAIIVGPASIIIAFEGYQIYHSWSYAISALILVILAGVSLYRRYF